MYVGCVRAPCTATSAPYVASHTISCSPSAGLPSGIVDLGLARAPSALSTGRTVVALWARSPVVPGLSADATRPLALANLLEHGAG